MSPRKCPAEIHPQIGPRPAGRTPSSAVLWGRGVQLAHGSRGAAAESRRVARGARALTGWPSTPPGCHHARPAPPSGPLPPAWSLCPESHRDVAVPPPSNLSTRSRPSLPFRLVFFSPRTHGRLPSGFASVRRSAPLRGTRSPPLAFDGAGHRLRACGRYPLNDLFPH